MLGTFNIPEFSLIFPISSIFGDLNPLEILNDILLKSFILCTIPKLPVKDELFISNPSNC